MQCNALHVRLRGGALVTGLTRILTACRERPLATFVPSESFARLRNRRHRLILVRAANRVGKTSHAAWVVAMEAIALPDVLGRPAVIRIIGPNRRQVNDAIGKMLAGFLAGHLSARSYYISGKGWNTTNILLANGSVIQLRSLEDDPQTHAGVELDLCVFDEVPKRAHFGENMARIGSVGGRMIVVMTAVDRPCGWLRELVEVEDTQWVQLVAAFSRENCPWYSKEIAEQILNNARASSWQWAQRVEGAWEGVSDNRELTGFTDDSVCTDNPTGTVDLMLSFDHGILAGKTVALLWAYRGGNSWVVDEYVSEAAMTPEQLAKEVDKMLARHGFDLRDVTKAVGDINVSGHTGRQINKELEQAFASMCRMRTPPFRIAAPYKTRGSVHYGIRLVNHAFIRKEIRVHSRCVKLIDACKHWEGGKTGDDGLLSDRIDPLRYGAVLIHGARKAYIALRIS